MGVGASMASGSHVWKGTCAAFAQAAIRIKRKTHDFRPGGSRPRAENSNELVFAKIIRMASSKKALPTEVIRSALNPARKLFSSWRKEISAHEHKVVISEKTRNWRKFGEIATPTMLVMNNRSQK